jgi:hypothetical protein
MKRILNTLSVILLLASLLLINSCSEDFLTKEPPGVGSASVIRTPAGVETALIATYERMQGAGRFGGAMGTDWTYASGASDDCYKGTSAGDQSAFNDVEKYNVLPSNPYMRERWRDCYDGVARANVTLEFLWETQKTNNPLPDNRAKEIEAEAKFLRAWFHFQANKVFENIPYIKTKVELGATLPEQVTNDDPAWDEIEADLQYAIDNLQTTHPRDEVGRPTKYSAEAVKAHVHMYQKEYSQAKPLLDDVLTNGGFELVQNYFENYDMTHENNKESIFEIQCSTTATSNSSMLLAGPVMHQKGVASCGGWGFFQPSQNLFDAFQVSDDGLPVLDETARVHLATDMGKSSADEFHPTDHLLDPRVDWTIARRGVDFLGWGIHPGNDWIRDMNNGGPFMTKKYMHMKSEQPLNTNGSGFDNGKNYRMYRLANVILWRAEIAVEDNDLELARTLVNKIRSRAKGSAVVMGRCTSYANLGKDPVVDWTLPAANYKIEAYPSGHPAFASQDQARKAVREEIRLEFATECHRFFDLRRWGIDDDVLNKYIAADQTFRTLMTGTHYNPNEDDYWPLPQDQLDLQKGVLKQDPAYGK